MFSSTPPGFRRVLSRLRTRLAVMVVSLVSIALLGLMAAPAQATASIARSSATASSTSTLPIAAPTAAARITPTRALVVSTKKSATRAVTSKIMRLAASRKGTPYRYGGTTTRGFDCSGYTRWVFKRLGVNLPRTSAAQSGAVTRTGSPKVGDLVFFRSGGRVHHVGIYAGHHQLWHSPYSGARVRKDRIWSGSVSYGHVKGLGKVTKKTFKKLLAKRLAATSATV